MKHIKYFTIVILYSIGVFVQSCTSENGMDEIAVSTSDINLTMDENPNIGQLITTIEGTTNQGTLSFELVEESNDGAFLVDQTTGALSVGNSYFFDFENYNTITAIVSVRSGDVSKQSLINITLNDLIENDLILEGTTSTVSWDPDCKFIADYNTELEYDGNYLYAWSGYLIGPGDEYRGDVALFQEIIDDKITKLSLRQIDFDDVFVLGIELTYDQNNRINTLRTFEPNNYYHIEYDNQNVMFIDQNNSTNFTATLDDQSRVVSWTDGTDTFSVEYDGANLMSKTYILNGVTYSATYEYDNKRNPFNTIPVLNLPQILDYFRVIGFHSYLKRSNNISRNTNSILKIDAPSGFFEGRVYEYEYNTDDYPSIKHVGDNGGKVIFTYQ
jgi:hypothetical protein